MAATNRGKLWHVFRNLGPVIKRVTRVNYWCTGKAMEGETMNAARKTDYLICQKCGKQLQAASCYNCKGNGKTQYLLFFSRACEICNGEGVLYQCPDQSNHLRTLETEIFSKWAGIQSTGNKSGSRQKCFVCGGAGWVRKSVHIPRPTDRLPGYPKLYKEMDVRCSNCSGDGWIE